ncbi:MAG TPA: DoxX family membrane protein [Candidatus Limnocylindria bacterium]|nr:DoxX family membrane protein [Candidatus Limnocylindria bacterium]
MFSSTRWAWIWLVLRLFLGWQWLKEGIDKAQSPGWIGANAGSFLTTWGTAALHKTGGAHPDVQGWYAAFLQHVVLPNAVFWSYAIVVGEVCVGLGLILGLFTGVAAFFGSFMNFNYLLAGTVSMNPIFFAIATMLVLAWKTAGWWGLDRWALPELGTPWRRGPLLARRPAVSVIR